MSVVILVGSQWGDEGKGKIIDFLSQEVDFIVRHQGGNNAGHTVYTGNDSFILHLIPSGIIHPASRCIIGQGTVIDPKVLLDEIETLRQKKVDVTPDRLAIAGSAHVIMPYHRLIDELQEKARGKGMIGTTKRGIGPAYSDKATRQGIRMWDLIDPQRLEERLEQHLPLRNAMIEKVLGGQPMAKEDILEEYKQYGQALKPFVTDTVLLLKEALTEENKVLFEGAQGSLLDIDFGTYPYVTSSNTISGGACTGTGLPPKKVEEIIGVAKAYCTRVGSGPFPTELPDEEADRIRNAGPVGEYGATTGRPRRCGWLDLPLLRYAVAVNGLTGLAVTRLDVLGELESIQVATRYRFMGSERLYPPGNMERLGECKPVLQEMPGWKSDISGITEFEQLPREAKDYIGLIEKELGIPVVMISVGPERKQTIVREKIF
jgi:adenylosuccinate synthase